MDINLVSLTDFRKNQKKYIGLAKTEKVFLTQRGTNEVIELVIREKIEISNLDRAISMSKLKQGIKEDLQKIFKQGKQ
jgi:hypothetical protein